MLRKGFLTVLAAAMAALVFVPASYSVVFIDFESVGNWNPVGDLYPETSFDHSWLGLVDLDAAGWGNFENEPSPNTVAFVYGSDVGRINFSLPTDYVSTWFVSEGSPVTLEAYSTAGLLTSVSKGPTSTGGAYNTWGFLELRWGSPEISYVKIHDSGGYFAVDDFTHAGSSGSPVPEPSTLLLLGSGLLGLAGYSRWRFRKL